MSPVSPEPESLRVQALLAEARWVGRLARKLVGEAAAEDVVQETWIAALRSPRGARAPLRPWLARVVANLALHRHRSEANRREREHAHARDEAMPPAESIAERIEAQQALGAALAALAEPYRTTVILRYFDELSAAEIARRQGIPAGTVRWRLKQGLDDLRLHLDVRFGERRAWCAALLTLVRKPPAAAPPAGPLLPEILAMSLAARLSLAAALALTITAGVWYATGGEEPSLMPAEPIAAGVPAAALEGDVPAIEREPESARSAAAAPGELGEAISVPPSPADTLARVEARCLDEFGRAIAGAELELLDFGLEARATSGAEGRVELEVEIAKPSANGRYRVFHPSRATQFATLILDRGTTAYIGDLVLAPGGSLAGEVVDGVGQPVADAKVFATRADLDRDADLLRRLGPETAPGVPSVRTDGRGSFRLEGVAAGSVRVWARAPGTRFAWSDPLEVEAQGLRENVRLVLEPLAAEDRIEGIVRTPDGRPVPGAPIKYSWKAPTKSSGSSGTQADPEGRFRIIVRELVPHALFATDPGGRWPRVNRSDVAPGTLDLELSFLESRELDLVVRTREGRAVESFSVRVYSPAEVDLHRVAESVHPGGRVQIQVPGEPFLIGVFARGHACGEIGPFAPENVPEEVELLLEPVPGVRGRVTADGQPIAGARVSAHQVALPETRVDFAGFPSRLMPQADDTGMTGADGRFELTLREAHSFALLAEADGYALAECAPLDIDPARGADGLEIALSRGGAIEGRVLVAAGREPSGIVVGASRADGRPHTVRVGPDGTFRLEGLTPGRWQVERVEREVREGGGWTIWSMGERDLAYVSNADVVEGEITRFDLDLREAQNCVLHCRVTVDGEPARGWPLRLQEGPVGVSRKGPGGALDARGEAVLEVGAPGQWQILLQPTVQQASEVQFAAAIALERGENQWSFAIDTGSVEGRVAARTAPGTRRWMYTWKGAALCAFYGAIVPDEQGHFRLPLVPAGHGEVLRWDLSANGPGEFAVVRTVEVVAGETAQVDL